VLLPIVRKRVGFTFIAVVVPVTVLAYLYLAGPMIAYGYYPLEFTQRQGGLWLIGGGALACLIAQRLWRVERVATAVRRWLPELLAVALGVLAVYAYFFRHEGGRLALHDAMAFRTLGWYLTPVGLAAAVAATVWLTRTGFWRDPAFFLTFAGYAVFFSYKTRIVPEHFWSARRFLGAILPGALLLIAASAVEIGRAAVPYVGRAFGPGGPDRLRRAPARLAATPFRRSSERSEGSAKAEGLLDARAVTAVALLLLAPFGWLTWRQMQPIRHHVEYAGVIPQLEKLARRIGDRDLLIVESRDAGSDLYTLAVPLVCIYARNALVLSSAAPDKRAFEDFVAWALARYEHVWFMGGGGTDLLTRRVSAEPAGGGQFQVPEYASPVNAYPEGVRRKDFEYGLYRLTAEPMEAEGPITLQVGGNDDLQVVRFYARERMGDTGLPFRWSSDQSFVVLPAIPDRARDIVIWMSDGGRPAEAPPAAVELLIDDRSLGVSVAHSEVEPHVFAIPEDVARRVAAQPDPLRLRLRVSTWNPHALLGAPDTRDLGVMVTRVDVR
jgi:hypothetical protein